MTLFKHTKTDVEKLRAKTVKPQQETGCYPRIIIISASIAAAINVLFILVQWIFK
ncbi:hypothetical protein [Moraxella caviae]|uniref:hypothetical protein n=1 Tax=Moraxella caviae TaxID=34060 RepID=UPI001300D95E|nr:hypothetical protein [Moraxella caviae]